MVFQELIDGGRLSTHQIPGQLCEVAIIIIIIIIIIISITIIIIIIIIIKTLFTLGNLQK